MIKSKIFISSLVIFQLFLLSKSSIAERGLTLCVHPYLPATELVKRFTPLVDYLSKKTGHSIKISISSDYQEHITKTGDGRADIAYMGPASYVKMTEEYGKKPLLTRLEIKGALTFRGAVIVRKDSSLKSMADLDRKSFVFGDPESTMSHLVPRFMLISEGVDIEKLKRYIHLKNHNNVALSVLAGDYDAGAVKEEVFFKYKERGLRVLSWTPEISEYLFIAGSSLPAETIEIIRNAMLQMNDSLEGREILKGIKKNMTGLVPVADSDYDNLRDILNTLEEGGIK